MQLLLITLCRKRKKKNRNESTRWSNRVWTSAPTSSTISILSILIARYWHNGRKQSFLHLYYRIFNMCNACNETITRCTRSINNSTWSKVWQGNSIIPFVHSSPSFISSRKYRTRLIKKIIDKTWKSEYREIREFRTFEPIVKVIESCRLVIDRWT